MSRVCRLTVPQWTVYSDEHRFRVLVSGRRFGKTRMAIEELLRAATAGKSRRVWYVAPTYRQAQQICWQMLKDRLSEGRWIARKNESDLSIVLKGTGSTISLRGADNFDSLRGVGLHFLVMDEFADIKPEAWFEVLRATLSDTGGKALFTGTPKGRNWAYDLFQRGSSEDYPEWASFSYTTIEGGNVPPEEVEAARRELDELTFKQEYEADFTNFEGRAYYPFAWETHCAPLRNLYNPRAPLAFCFDFNVEPGVACVCQEVTLPNGLEGTAVIGEVYIPRNSNTPAVCRKLIQDWGKHEGRIVCYGDATGGSRGSAKVEGSDWDLIKAEFRRSPFAQRIAYDVPNSNPPERARVNATNSRLKSESGDIRLMVDATYAPHVVKDLEGVILLKGGSGEIDKKSTPELTHMCFCADTEVITKRGLCKIGHIPQNGLVLTWNGSFVGYKNAVLTQKNVKTVSVFLGSGQVIKCTPEHAFLTNRGWVCAKDLTGCCLITPDLLSYAVKQSRYFKGLLITGTMGINDIFAGLQTLVSNICTELFGFIITEKSQRDSMCITLMEIEQIIRFKISNWLKDMSTCPNTMPMSPKNCGSEEKKFLQQIETRPLHGTEVQRDGLGIKNTGKARMLQNMNVFAQTAEKHLWQNSQNPNFVQKPAKQCTEPSLELIMRFAIASFVEELLLQINTTKNAFVDGIVLQNITGVRENAQKSDVFCLSVPNHGCFCLGNNAIVSNSDSLGYYVQRKFPTTKHTMIVSRYSTI